MPYRLTHLLAHQIFGGVKSIMKKVIYLALLSPTLLCAGLRAESLLYLEPARHFLLNPALLDSCTSVGAKCYNSADKVSEYHLSLCKPIHNFGFSFDSDYLYFSNYKKLQTVMGVSYRGDNFLCGNNFTYWQNSEDESEIDYSFSLGINLFTLENYLVCTSAKDNEWAMEFRKSYRFVFRVDEENFLLATDVPISSFSSLQVSAQKSTLGSGLKFFCGGFFVQFATIHHRYVEPDYLLSVGLDL